MAQQYNRNKILTATPAELTLLLYEGAIKFCNIAQVAIEKNDTEKAHTNIVKAEMIIEELQSTLNRKYPVAEDFDNVYKYIYSLLVDANMKKDTQVLDGSHRYLAAAVGSLRAGETLHPHCPPFLNGERRADQYAEDTSPHHL